MTRQDLLRSWTTALRRLQHEHEIASRDSEKWSLRLAVVAASASTIAGATILSAKSGVTIGTASWIAGISSLIAALSSAIQAVFNFAQRSMGHKSAAAKFAELAARCEMGIIQQIDDAACDKMLVDIRSNWTRAQADAPNLRESIIRDINSTVEESSSVT